MRRCAWWRSCRRRPDRPPLDQASRGLGRPGAGASDEERYPPRRYFPPVCRCRCGCGSVASRPPAGGRGGTHSGKPLQRRSAKRTVCCLLHAAVRASLAGRASHRRLAHSGRLIRGGGPSLALAPPCEAHPGVLRGGPDPARRFRPSRGRPGRSLRAHRGLPGSPGRRGALGAGRRNPRYARETRREHRAGPDAHRRACGYDSSRRGDVRGPRGSGGRSRGDERRSGARARLAGDRPVRSLADRPPRDRGEARDVRLRRCGRRHRLHPLRARVRYRGPQRG